MEQVGRRGRQRPGWRRNRTASVLVLAGAFVVGFVPAGLQGAGAAAPTTTEDTGFSEPFSGTPQYEAVAPTQATDAGQINQPIGPIVAGEIARKIGLNKDDVFSELQYRAFISGQGRDHTGDLASAKLVDESVKILTNTVHHPLPYKDANGKAGTSVLASYGVFVTTNGDLESPAYEQAPTFLVNMVIEPGGYMSTWMKANGARKSLEQLYKSAYTSEAAYGNEAQMNSEPNELVTNTKDGVSAVVGMSMAPALWIVNFALIYTLNPSLAAEMPAKWVPLPLPVVQAFQDSIASKTPGVVPYSEVASDFPR